MSLLYLDIETDNSNGAGLDVFSSKIVTVQILLPSGNTIILKDPKSLDNVKPLLENNLVIGHNLKFDSKFLKHHFGVTLYNVHDTYLAEIILSGGLYAGKHGVTGLKDLVFRYCGQQMNKEEQQGFRCEVPLTQEQKQYAANDLKYLPEIFKQQQAKIKLLRLEGVINTEMKALPAIVWLELSGIFVDLERLNEIQKEIEAKRSKAEQSLYETFGTSKINLNSPQQLKKELNRLGIPVESTKAEELAKFDHPIIQKLKEYKEAEKLLNTFVGKLPNYINKKTGRIHADFFQLGAKSGRLSCTKPNLQQQPSKTLPEWRTIFKAPAGNKIITADYSQIELRILAQVSQDQEYIKAYKEGADLHKLTASKIFQKPINEVEKKDRSIAKTVNFGIAYGMWTFGLQKKLKAAGIEVTEKEAEGIIKGFYEAYPGVAKYLKHISTQGLRNLEVRNSAGRLMIFEKPEDDKARNSIKRESKNLPVQSLCADMLKTAMSNLFLRLEPMGVKFINTVHDELVFECTEALAEEVKEMVKIEMEKAGALFLTDLPSVAEVTVGDTWEK
ncbi:DNA polymerase I [Methanosarcina lacustris Z-7289]|uniref:DNA polymerase I n=1 Tax=Methanosarcina lacustris Z-7289 TaxID=1434111 RepID=A0A0E3S437_9EURY|nr:DNA polymerase [Methanosarcina lacustris]AKB75784.1 DNA polymerase I [Methanosarcina lacustris Z-7289]